jgi:hypothetical protein
MPCSIQAALGERLRQMQADRDRLAAGLESSANEREQIMREAEQAVLKSGMLSYPGRSIGQNVQGQYEL